MDPKKFLRAAIYISFEEVAWAEKTQFFGQKFPEGAFKTPFWPVFQHFACNAQNLAKTGAKQCFGRSRKINLFELKKGQSFRTFFENPSPPRENPRYTPKQDCSCVRATPECCDVPLISYRRGFGKRKHWTPVNFGRSQGVKFWVVRNKND